MKEKKKLLYDTYEKPTLGKWIILAIQHVFAMFGYNYKKTSIQSIDV